MRRLVVATTNRDKLREIRRLLADAPVTLVGLDELPETDEPEETGVGFEDNARIKARHYSEDHFDLVVAEDSGLVIDALGGEPGVRSARFLGRDASYPERFEEIFRRLAQSADTPRTARFICALAVARRGAIVYEAAGVIEGEIAHRPSGTAGFGYDPIFYYPPSRCTLAEMSEVEKLRQAHRGHAFRTLAQWLQDLGPEPPTLRSSSA